jgi:hypothetical protein
VLGTPSRDPHRDHVLLGNEGIDGKPQIREGCAPASDNLLQIRRGVGEGVAAKAV